MMMNLTFTKNNENIEENSQKLNKKKIKKKNNRSSELFDEIKTEKKEGKALNQKKIIAC